MDKKNLRELEEETYQLLFPCYKVVNSQGKLAPSFVFGGCEEQRKRLERDGIKVINNKVDLKIYQWK